MTHTILLHQATNQPSSRTYYDFDTIQAAVDHICTMYETRLKKNNPTAQNITYDISELFAWIDSQPDMACLVFEVQLQAYSPHPKDWIKQKVLSALRKQQ
eukprot:c21381_g1_i1.p1 GENE.c21381_g1_i1~~c21381_g1_i1.p1  ORF type:complete len:100 (+),score=28.99 c21381_g1_i1:30-329(+)